MPIRSSKSVREAADARRSSDADLRNTVGYHNSVILMLFVFVLLSSFAFALWMLKLSIAQSELAIDVNAIVPHDAVPAVPVEPVNSRDIQPGKQTLASNVYADWMSCANGYVGECDDVVLYTPDSTGQKSVLIPSLRALFPVGKLPWPDMYSYSGRYLALRIQEDEQRLLALAGQSSSTEQSLFLVDTLTGEVRKMNQFVPVGAMYGMDNTVAFYFQKGKDGDYRQLVAVNLLKDTSKIIAKAGSDESFWDGVTVPQILGATSDNRTVTLNVYTVSKTKNAPPVKTMKTVKFSF